jgi:hypothetical protein
MTTTKLFLQEIHIPLPCDKHGIDNFITPFWKEVLDFYPEWLRQVVEKGGDPWSFQPYTWAVCRELVRLEVRAEYNTPERWLGRCVEHHGVEFLVRYVEKYQGMANGD